MAATTTLQTRRRFCPPKICLHCRLHLDTNDQILNTAQDAERSQCAHRLCLAKMRRNVVTFFKARKDLAFFHLLQPRFVLDGLFTTPVYSRRRSLFVNSAFPSKKIWPKNRRLFMTNKFESKMFAKILRSSKQQKEWYRKTTSYLEQPSRHFCQHFTPRTTQQTLLAINLASHQKTTKLYFFSQVRKQFKLLKVPFNPSRCCLRSDKLVNCHV